MADDGSGIVLRCPCCPVCGEPPVVCLWPEQAFCGNDDCEVLIWDMTESAQANLTQASEVQSFGTMKDGRTWDTRRGDEHPTL